MFQSLRGFGGLLADEIKTRTKSLLPQAKGGNYYTEFTWPEEQWACRPTISPDRKPERWDRSYVETKRTLLQYWPSQKRTRLWVNLWLFCQFIFGLVRVCTASRTKFGLFQFAIFLFQVCVSFDCLLCYNHGMIPILHEKWYEYSYHFELKMDISCVLCTIIFLRL